MWGSRLRSGSAHYDLEPAKAAEVGAVGGRGAGAAGVARVRLFLAVGVAVVAGFLVVVGVRVAVVAAVVVDVGGVTIPVGGGGGDAVVIVMPWKISGHLVDPAAERGSAAATFWALAAERGSAANNAKNDVARRNSSGEHPLGGVMDISEEVIVAQHAADTSRHGPVRGTTARTAPVNRQAALEAICVQFSTAARHEDLAVRLLLTDGQQHPWKVDLNPRDADRGKATAYVEALLAI
eukprot:s735_g9.t2